MQVAKNESLVLIPFMAKVTFITADGKEIVEENGAGSVMEIAQQNQVPGIEGACGGCCSCATCHVRVHPDWIEKTGRATESEQDLLDLESEACDRSRLSCQIELTEELDGLVVEVAPL
jgi:2Fe-2S ferredoxin